MKLTSVCFGVLFVLGCNIDFDLRSTTDSDSRTDSDSSVIQPDDLVGYYERTPVENNWHKVTITLEGNELFWNNAENRSWSLALIDGVLTTGADCPYGEQVVEILTLPGTNTVTGLEYNNDLYQRF